MLAHLTVTENYSRVALSEYMDQFVSSVEVIGAVLVTDGNCSLDEASVAMNISTRVSMSEGDQNDLEIVPQIIVILL